MLQKQTQNEAAYNNYIKLADAAFQNNELQQAKGQYQAALTVKSILSISFHIGILKLSG